MPGGFPEIACQFIDDCEEYRSLFKFTAGIISVYAVVYWLFGLVKTPCGELLNAADLAALGEALGCSFIAFGNPGFTDYTPAGTVGRLLTASETAFGIIVFALFIFIIGRRSVQ